MAKQKIHFAQFLTHGPSYHSLGMWRHPKTEFTTDNWARPELYQHIAKTCERGLFDMVFFADLDNSPPDGPFGFQIEWDCEQLIESRYGVVETNIDVLVITIPAG